MRKLLLVVCLLIVPALVCAEGPSNMGTQTPVCLMRTSMGDIWLELWPDAAPKTVENFIGLAEGKKEFFDLNTKKKVTRPFYDGLIFHRVIKDFMIQGGCPRGDGTGGPGYRFEDEINADALGLDNIKAVKGNRTHPYLGIRSESEFRSQIIFPLAKKMGASSAEEALTLMDDAYKKLPELTLKACYENLGYEYNPELNSRHLVKGVLAMANSGPNANGSQFFICLADTPWLDGKHTAFGKVIKGFEVVEAIGKVEVDNKKRPLKDVKILSIKLEAR